MRQGDEYQGFCKLARFLQHSHVRQGDEQQHARVAEDGNACWLQLQRSRLDGNEFLMG